MFSRSSSVAEFYTLSLHDALPISLSGCANRNRSRDRPSRAWSQRAVSHRRRFVPRVLLGLGVRRDPLKCGFLDRKSTRLNSSHVKISYAVFCLNKKTGMQAVDKLL